jgi:threonine/homoserine/homoserine lactone efflux protein
VPTNASIIAFIAASLVVLLVPGPGVLYVVARSLAQGQRAGLISVLGLSAGVAVHVVAATAGLSAILMTSAITFSVVKMLGAAYLIYLGVRILLARPPQPLVDRPAARTAYRLFVDGVVVSVLNPKIAIFFLAFLPQFADSKRGAIPQQILLLGLIYVALALITDGTYAILAGRTRRCLAKIASRTSWSRYASGIVFIGLGIGTAVADRHS